MKCIQYVLESQFMFEYLRILMRSLWDYRTWNTGLLSKGQKEKT